MNKSSKTYLIFIGIFLIDRIQAMDNVTPIQSELATSFRNSAGHLHTFCENLLNWLLGSQTYTGPDYLSALPHEILCNHIIPHTITNFDLTDFHGVKKAITFLAKLRRVNRTFYNILTNDEIARILRKNKANLNDVDIYESDFEKSTMWEHFNDLTESYPFPNNPNQFLLARSLFYNYFGIKPFPKDLSDETLIKWAVKNGNTQLADILIKAGADIPQDLLLPLKGMGINATNGH